MILETAREGEGENKEEGEMRRERKKERGKHQPNALTRDPTLNLGMWPDWKSNPKLFFVYGMMLQLTEPNDQDCTNF